MIDVVKLHVNLSTSNTTASVRRTSLYACAVRAVREKFKSSCDGGVCGSKKCRRGFRGACGGVWWSPCLSGVWSKSVGFVLVRLTGIWLQSP
jgi:hypothetical protein